jgi:hypothetical protein
MAITGRGFEEVYKKPKSCGHEAQSCESKNMIGDIGNTCKTLIDG